MVMSIARRALGGSRLLLAWPMALGLGGVLLGPRLAPAIDVSGTVQYSGGQGPVSAARPIQVAVIDPSWRVVSAMPVTASPAPFVLSVPDAGDFYLAALLDVVPDGGPSIGEPYALYDRQLDPSSADVIHVPAEGLSGLTVAFDDTGILSGIGGTVTYTGSAGAVSGERPLRIVVFGDPDLTAQIRELALDSNGARFTFETFDTNSYYVVAFFDVNGSGALDAGDPFTIYRDRGSSPADPIIAGPAQNAVEIAFGDEHIAVALTPTPTDTPPSATPTVTAGPACAGDCDGDGTVAVNELIRGVTIALGTSALAACPSFDTDGSTTLTVNELIRAVANALNGC